MRKIEEAMNSAIRDKANMKQGNTEVKYATTDETGAAYEHATVFLFGKHIADFVYYPQGPISHTGYISDVGMPVVDIKTLAKYPTKTTRSRLSALGVNVYQRKHETYLGDLRVSDLIKL